MQGASPVKKKKKYNIYLQNEEEWKYNIAENRNNQVQSNTSNFN